MSNTNAIRDFVRLAVILMLCFASAAAQGAATLRGQITDQLGAVITGASVTLINEAGEEQVTKTDERGVYRFSNLRPGTYRLQAIHRGFAADQQKDVTLTDGQMRIIDLKLAAAIENQRLTVQVDQALNDPGSNKNATSIKGKDLDALPDDTDALVGALEALAGPAAGPEGAEISLDGFTSAAPIRPDKQSIREIAINRNPFSAENDRIGFARIDIFTKPGTGKIHGGLDFNFSDDILNSRNPYSIVKPSAQRRAYSGNLSGPLISKKASFFLAVNRRDLDEVAVSNAVALDDNLNVINLNEIALTPEKYLIITPRFDFQLNGTNTLRVNHTYNISDLQGTGPGGFALASHAADEKSTIHQLNLTETSILSPRVVNELRFQYFWWHRTSRPDNPGMELVVDEAFEAGKDLNSSSYTQNMFEVSNYTTLATRQHTLKFGGRFRYARIRDIDDSRRFGQWQFFGRLAPELDRNNQPVLGPDGQFRLINIQSIEAYRRTLLFQRMGVAPQQIRALGGGATHFVIGTGTTFAKVSQQDFGGFIQDDWKLLPNFSLSMGLRYQIQTNAEGNNFAPRVAFAWMPWTKGNSQRSTVIRGGAGIFYDLVRTTLALSAAHKDGITAWDFFVADPQVLDSFPNVPSSAILASLPRAMRSVEPDIREPNTIQASISIEQSLPHNTILTASYLYAHGLHLLRSRNINAPLPGTPGSVGNGPFGNTDTIIEYESNGNYRQKLLIVNASLRPSSRLTLSLSYALGYTNSDTDWFPSNPYNLRGEFARSESDLRNRLVLSGTVSLPWAISLNPFIVAQSGPPFDIRTGRDNNNDLFLADRPTFAGDRVSPSVISTPLGNFDLEPRPSDQIIRRSLGQSPGYFSTNLRLSKAFAFGGEQKASANSQASATRPYRLVVGLYAVNIFNRTNEGARFGSLSGALFGTSNALMQVGQRSPSSNRGITLNTIFSF